MTEFFFNPESFGFIKAANSDRERGAWKLETPDDIIKMKYETNVYGKKIFTIYKNGKKVYYGFIHSDKYASQLFNNIFLLRL